MTLIFFFLTNLHFEPLCWGWFLFWFLHLWTFNFVFCVWCWPPPKYVNLTFVKCHISSKLLRLCLAICKIFSDDTRKNYNSFHVHDGSSWSTTSAHGSQDEETRPEPSRKDEFQASSSIAKPRPESTRQWIVQTRHWTSHLSVIDKVDGNRCQRRLDELGQTIRCQKQLTYC